MRIVYEYSYEKVDLHYDDETIAAALNVKRTSARTIAPTADPV